MAASVAASWSPHASESRAALDDKTERSHPLGEIRMRKLAGLVALAVIAASCGDQNAPTEIVSGSSLVKGPLVRTPSGAVFTEAEWNAKENKSPWLETVDDRLKRV